MSDVTGIEVSTLNAEWYHSRSCLTDLAKDCTDSRRLARIPIMLIHVAGGLLEVAAIPVFQPFVSSNAPVGAKHLCVQSFISHHLQQEPSHHSCRHKAISTISMVCCETTVQSAWLLRYSLDARPARLVSLPSLQLLCSFTSGSCSRDL